MLMRRLFRLFRLSQTFKPEASVDQYAPVLNAALDALLDTPLEAIELDTKINDGSLAMETPEAFQMLLQGYFGSMSGHWERLNARRLELEALRLEHRLSAVHENSVATLRGGLRLINLRGEVTGQSAKGDWAAAQRMQKELDFWSGVVESVMNKLSAALRRLHVEQPDLFTRLNLPAPVLDVFDP